MTMWIRILHFLGLTNLTDSQMLVYRSFEKRLPENSAQILTGRMFNAIVTCALIVATSAVFLRGYQLGTAVVRYGEYKLGQAFGNRKITFVSLECINMYREFVDDESVVEEDEVILEFQAEYSGSPEIVHWANFTRNGEVHEINKSYSFKVSQFTEAVVRILLNRGSLMYERINEPKPLSEDGRATIGAHTIDFGFLLSDPDLPPQPVGPNPDWKYRLRYIIE